MGKRLETPYEFQIFSSPAGHSPFPRLTFPWPNTAYDPSTNSPIFRLTPLFVSLH